MEEKRELKMEEAEKVAGGLPDRIDPQSIVDAQYKGERVEWTVNPAPVPLTSAIASHGSAQTAPAIVLQGDFEPMVYSPPIENAERR